MRFRSKPHMKTNYKLYKLNLIGKIREKSLVIKSEVFIGLLKRENAGKERRKKFPDPKLVTFDIPHGPNTKFLKKCQKNAQKIRGKSFSHFFLFKN